MKMVNGKLVINNPTPLNETVDIRDVDKHTYFMRLQYLSENTIVDRYQSVRTCLNTYMDSLLSKLKNIKDTKANVLDDKRKILTYSGRANVTLPENILDQHLSSNLLNRLSGFIETKMSIILKTNYSDDTKSVRDIKAEYFHEFINLHELPIYNTIFGPDKHFALIDIDKNILFNNINEIDTQMAIWYRLKDKLNSHISQLSVNIDASDRHKLKYIQALMQMSEKIISVIIMKYSDLFSIAVIMKEK